MFICLSPYFADITGQNIKPLPKKKKKNTGKHLPDFKYECLFFFLYVGLIYPFVQYVSSLTIVTTWLLTVVLFDQMQVFGFLHFLKVDTLFLKFSSEEENENFAACYLWIIHLPFPP